MNRISLGSWVSAVRAYQWIKNGLVFVPLLTSFSFTQVHEALLAVAAFVAFSCVASGNYLINDVVDRASDRNHPRKRSRPIASGAISVAQAGLVSAVLLALGFVVAVYVGRPFLFVLAGYVVLTILYSLKLKRVVFVDVLTLACLYTVRIVAGALAIQVVLTSWLLAFSIFLFLSLALVKRCAELVMLERAGRADSAGRGYLVSDLRVLWPIGTGAAMCSVVVFGLYISAEETQARYASPNLIWLAGIGLIYWLARLWIKASRGEMHDDPIVFTMYDRPSQLVIGFMIAATLAAYVIRI